MAVLEVLAGLLLTQAAPMMTVEAESRASREPTGWSDVGYAELRAGRPAEAIAKIRGNRALEANDPAALINLGSAHAQLGRRYKAERLYKAAILSRSRYELQLAGGQWMDSRQAARAALAALDRAETVLVLR